MGLFVSCQTVLGEEVVADDIEIPNGAANPVAQSVPIFRLFCKTNVKSPPPFFAFN